MPVYFNQPIRNYQQNQKAIDAAISRVLNSGYYILGDEVKCFEEQFADYCGVQHCIGVASGTDALLIALRAAGVEHGNEVITVANAGCYTSTACFQIGAVPVYVDVRPDTLVLDTNHVADAITDNTRAIVATHLFGNMVDMPPLQKLAAHHDVMLIEDCAQAHGALQNGQRAGSFGDIGVFSFYPTKNLGALGDGGALVCSNEELSSAIHELHQYGWSKKYHVERPYGVNSRLDPIQAAILTIKLPKLDAANQRRRDIVNKYKSDLDEFGLHFCYQNDSSYTGHLCVIRHSQRDMMRRALSKAGIGTDIHYPILDFEQPGLKQLKSRTQSSRISEQACREIFSLPLYPELLEEEIEAVSTSLKSVLESLVTNES